MKIMVTVKQVPDTSGKVAVNEDGTLNRASMQAIINPDDLNAVEEALSLARRYYNGTVRDLNTKIESFPVNIVAGMFGFVKAEFFELNSISDAEATVVNL